MTRGCGIICRLALRCHEWGRRDLGRGLGIVDDQVVRMQRVALWSGTGKLVRLVDICALEAEQLTGPGANKYHGEQAWSIP